MSKVKTLSKLDACCEVTVTEMHISLDHLYGIALRRKNKVCFVTGS